MCIAALYINTAVSFKSNITKIYYCWPAGLLYFRSYYSKRPSVSLVCDMPGTLIPFSVSHKISLFQRSQSEVTYSQK